MDNNELLSRHQHASYPDTTTKDEVLTPMPDIVEYINGLHKTIESLEALPSAPSDAELKTLDEKLQALDHLLHYARLWIWDEQAARVRVKNAQNQVFAAAKRMTVDDLNI